MHIPPLILAIDDSAEFLEIISLCLTQAGFEVKTASEVMAGFEIARSEKPDLILLDINMLGTNGTEALIDFKKDTALLGIKVAFLTDMAVPWLAVGNKEEFAKEIGAVAFFDKSKDLESLAEKIKGILGV